MTKKRSSEFSTGRNCKIPKKVVLQFFGQMCSGEFFLKHALTKPTTQTLYCLHLKIYYITTSLFGKCGKFWSVQISNARSRPIAVISVSRSAYRGLDHSNHLSIYLSITPSEIIISGLLKRMVIYCFDLSLGEYLMRDSCCHCSVFP